MTPSEIETLARQRYNAVGDTFFPQLELMNLIYDASLQLAMEARVIQARSTFSSVANQRAYDYPTRTIAIKRIEYDGRRLDPMDLIDDDTVTLLDSNDVSTGTPRFYAVWNDVIYMRPIPDSVKTVTIYTYQEPATVSAASTLDVPDRYHPAIVDYLLFCMFSQDQNRGMAQTFQERWEQWIVKAKRWERKREVGDQYKTVKDIEFIPTNYVRII